MPISRALFIEKTRDVPEIKRNKGIIKSQKVKPCQVVCSICLTTVSVHAHPEPSRKRYMKAPPPAINNMSKPRNASIEASLLEVVVISGLL
jgi:hypothetical protein